MGQNQNSNELGWGIWPGVAGGIGTYFLQMQADHPFAVQLFKSVGIALACGAAGALGKWLFDTAKVMVYQYFAKNKNKK